MQVTCVDRKILFSLSVEVINDDVFSASYRFDVERGVGACRTVVRRADKDVPRTAYAHYHHFVARFQNREIIGSYTGKFKLGKRGDNKVFLLYLFVLLVKESLATFAVIVRRYAFARTGCGNAFVIGQFVRRGDNKVFLSYLFVVLVKIFTAIRAVIVSNYAAVFTVSRNAFNQSAVVVIGDGDNNVFLRDLFILRVKVTAASATIIEVSVPFVFASGGEPLNERIVMLDGFAHKVIGALLVNGVRNIFVFNGGCLGVIDSRACTGRFADAATDHFCSIYLRLSAVYLREGNVSLVGRHAVFAYLPIPDGGRIIVS